MTERDDYLFDPGAPPDPDVVAMEQALSPLAYRDRPWRDGPSRDESDDDEQKREASGHAAAEPPAAKHRRRRLWPLLAAALLAVAALFWSRSNGLQPASAPRTFIAKHAELAVRLGKLAEITLRPGSELEFLHWQPEQALFRLRRGGLTARVAPPPVVPAGFFVVDTPLGRVVDQGCRYELDLRDDDSALVHVTEGAVTFAAGDRVVFVPAGASTIVGPLGASTPLFIDADAALRRAVREFDALLLKGAAIDRRQKSLEELIATARSPRASLVLWHLLRDPEPELRQSAEQRLLELVGPPPGADSKEGIDPELWLPHLRLSAWQGGG